MCLTQFWTFLVFVGFRKSVFWSKLQTLKQSIASLQVTMNVKRTREMLHLHIIVSFFKYVILQLTL